MILELSEAIEAEDRAGRRDGFARAALVIRRQAALGSLLRHDRPK